MSKDDNLTYTSFLGTGWSFPPSFSRVKKSLILTSDEEDIKKSLEILLSTTVGERIMQPKYGCNLNNLLFEPLTTSFITYIEGMVKRAILHFEPRIDLKKITVDSSSEFEGRIDINVDYIIRTTNSRHNYVYPFYKEELAKQDE